MNKREPVTDWGLCNNIGVHPEGETQVTRVAMSTDLREHKVETLDKSAVYVVVVRQLF